METFEGCFSDVPDPRAGNAIHELSEIVFIALAATLCGAASCTDMADFGRAKEPLLRQVLRLERGIPSHDTFSRIFRVLDPVAFEAAFRKFMAAFSQAAEIKGVVAIDGKAVKGAFERGQKATPLHLVNVWAAESRLALAQYTAPSRNEAAGALAVLKLLSLQGCIVTADALHCRRDTARAILDAGGDYVLALKDNQPKLSAAAKACIDTAACREEAEQEPALSHGRHEHRHGVVVATSALANPPDFPGLQAVARITARRWVDGKESVRVRYFLLSRPLSAQRLLEVVREHWGIENQLHWVLDVVFDEDGARNRKDHGPENLAVLRKLALNILRAHPDKASLRRKVKRAGWDDAFFFSLLTYMR